MPDSAHAVLVSIPGPCVLPTVHAHPFSLSEFISSCRHCVILLIHAYLDLHHIYLLVFPFLHPYLTLVFYLPLFRLSYTNPLLASNATHSMRSRHHSILYLFHLSFILSLSL